MRSDFKAIVIILIIQLSAIPHANGVIERDFSLTSNPTGPIVSMGFDAAGYSDWWDWGYHSPRHPYSAHEMLSGEWAGAVYYEGIASGDAAMWLTDQFSYANWPTSTGFTQVSYNSWNNAVNPIIGLDTAQSVIQNSQLRITIDYEMVDLGEQGPNGEGGSPMAFGSLVGADAFVYSEQYVLLQTYTIKNITASSIQNLQFYQMLHGHPADEGNAVVYSVYDSTYHEDPLESYVPYNEVHTVDNFRYDITQWNNSDDPDKRPQVDHRDWMGFSSTVEPDFLENGYYIGGHSEDPDNKPDPPGTHWNIESKTLNEQSYSFGEAAGAMGWSLGTLAPYDSVKLTLAIMFGAGPIQKSCEQIEPVAHWSLDEGSGTTAYDSIGDNDGTLFGNPQWVTGHIDGALEFDGADDYVKLSDPVGLLMGDSVTVSAWVKPGEGMVSASCYDVFSQAKGNLNTLAGYDLYLKDYKPGFFLASPDCSVESSGAIGTNQWTWVVGTYDGSDMRLYVNGTEAASTISPGHMGVHSSAYIGHLPIDPPFIGAIDCVWVFACAWDPSQDCLLSCHEDYDEWFEAGRPDCWCTPYQCDGDAAVDVHVRGYRVYTTDLTILSDSWKLKAGDPGLNPCADIDHEAHSRGYRVYTGDMDILAANWKRKDFPDLPADCAVRGCGEAARSGSSSAEVTSKELLDWLAEIWLDPEVRDGMDAEAWLKLYESMKEAE